MESKVVTDDRSGNQRSVPVDSKGKKLYSNPMSERLHGRRKIIVDDTEVTDKNVIDVLRKAIRVHIVNQAEIQYLYQYKKGDQPILHRFKNVRPEIVSHIVENRASQIVNFKTGYMFGSSKPIQYIASCSDGRKEDLTEKAAQLNEFMDDTDMPSKNKELFDWIFTCGIGYKMVLPNVEAKDEHDTPFEVYVLDPRNTFVVHSNELGEPPIMGVRFVEKENHHIVYSCYTKNAVYTVEESIVKDKKKYSVIYSGVHVLADIPIVEYMDNKEEIGAFEEVITLLDAINQSICERQEGIEQFVQSLLLFHNVDISSDDFDTLREQGAIKYKDVSPEQKAEIGYISLELNQDSVQAHTNDLIKSVSEICGIPSMSDGSTSDSSNNGAVIMRQGWGHAEARAKNSEEEFTRSERNFLKIVLRICEYNTGALKGLTPKDVQIRFTRRNYEDIQTKAQVLNMLLNNEKVDPKLAFEHSGVFVDPERAYLQSMEYMKKQSIQQQRLIKQSVDVNNAQTSAQNPQKGATKAKTNADEKARVN